MIKNITTSLVIVAALFAFFALGWFAAAAEGSLVTNPIYLDFNGDPTANILPFAGTDADKAVIEQNVREAFAPFNVAVTDVDPGYQWDDFLSRWSDPNGVRVLIGQPTMPVDVGGSAAIGGFTSQFTTNHTCYVYLVGDWFITCGVCHEVGHTLGLQHQSVWQNGVLIAEYNPGLPDELAGPWMGISYSDLSGLWWVGLNDQGVMQDDAAIIASVVGYVPEPPAMVLIGLALAVGTRRRTTGG